MLCHHQGSAASERTSLLFIDDDPNVIASLRMLFEPEFKTFSASTVEEGVGAFREIHPQVVVLDLRLPDKNGLEALREIRELDQNACVIVLTGYATLPAVEELMRLGAVDCLHKPFDAHQLRERIRSIATPGEDGHPHIVAPPVRPPDAELLAGASSAFLHDVTNPLTGIVSLAEFLRCKLTEPNLSAEELRSVVELIAENTLYISSLVEQWRAFTDPESMPPACCSAKTVIELALRLVSAKAAESGVTLTVDIPKGSWEIRASRFAIARVLVNIIGNAIDACRDSGRQVRVSTAKVGNMIEMTILDNGHGIAVDPVDRIFEPRFTTKDMGMGLGLFISRKIVESVGGSIRVRRPGSGGAEFTVTLPSA